MRARMLSGLLVGCFLFSTFSTLVGQEANEKDSKRYILESERQWADSVATGDTGAAKRILADDFVGVDPEGNFYDKAKMIADTSNAPKYFISNHLNEVKLRFYGDTAVAQGSESWERRTGTPKRGSFV